MGSLFDDLMAELGVPALMDHLADGTSITYTDGGGSATSCKAILYDEMTEEEETLDGIVRKRVREITVHTDAESAWGGIADPQLAATVTIGSITYAVESVGPVSDNFVTLKLVRRSRREVTRENYRR